MNVASKDLCEELYGLSKWDGTPLGYGYNELDEDFVFLGEMPRDYTDPQGNDNYLVAPAYDLGYLLRKLTFWTLESKHFDQFKASHRDINGKNYSCHADTPEDAACKLAIELFKQGILKKEEGNA